MKWAVTLKAIKGPFEGKIETAYFKTRAEAWECRMQLLELQREYPGEYWVTIHEI